MKCMQCGVLSKLVNMWACCGGWVTSCQPVLPGWHPLPPPAWVDAIGQWDGAGWPTCLTSASAPCLLPCYPRRSCRWHRSSQFCHSPVPWPPLGFSIHKPNKDSIVGYIMMMLMPRIDVRGDTNHALLEVIIYQVYRLNQRWSNYIMEKAYSNTGHKTV